MLISHTKDPEYLVASAAKLCYSSNGISDLLEGLDAEKVKNFLNMLVELGHESPIEHVNFTFGIEGISRSLLAQITRHRIASFSVQSQRYVNEEQFRYVIPPEIENIEQAKDEFIKAMEEDKIHYDHIALLLKKKHKERFQAMGKSEIEAEKLAEKSAIEDARFVLPNACATKMICTFNARSLMNFFRHRLCNRAQWEIRELALQMLRLVLEVAPNLFKQVGPSCLKGECKEKRMSCGRQRQVKDFFCELYEKY
jgi:thymidylate synthase (FAD)